MEKLIKRDVKEVEKTGDGLEVNPKEVQVQKITPKFPLGIKGNGNVSYHSKKSKEQVRR